MWLLLETVVGFVREELKMSSMDLRVIKIDRDLGKLF
jgi:hypothetical protein